MTVRIKVIWIWEILNTKGTPGFIVKEFNVESHKIHFCINVSTHLGSQRLLVQNVCWFIDRQHLRVKVEFWL